MTFPSGLGSVIAVIVLILAIVMGVMHQLDVMPAVLFAMLAIARLT